jgi:hypothetical protein
MKLNVGSPHDITHYLSLSHTQPHASTNAHTRIHTKEEEEAEQKKEEEGRGRMCMIYSSKDSIHSAKSLKCVPSTIN